MPLPGGCPDATALRGVPEARGHAPAHRSRRRRAPQGWRTKRRSKLDRRRRPGSQAKDAGRRGTPRLERRDTSRPKRRPRVGRRRRHVIRGCPKRRRRPEGEGVRHGRPRVLQRRGGGDAGRAPVARVRIFRDESRRVQAPRRALRARHGEHGGGVRRADGASLPRRRGRERVEHATQPQQPTSGWIRRFEERRRDVLHELGVSAVVHGARAAQRGAQRRLHRARRGGAQG